MNCKISGRGLLIGVVLGILVSFGVAILMYNNGKLFLPSQVTTIVDRQKHLAGRAMGFVYADAFREHVRSEFAAFGRDLGFDIHDGGTSWIEGSSQFTVYTECVLVIPAEMDNRTAENAIRQAIESFSDFQDKEGWFHYEDCEIQVDPGDQSRLQVMLIFLLDAHSLSKEDLNLRTQRPSQSQQSLAEQAVALNC